MRRCLPLAVVIFLLSSLVALAGDAQWVEVRSPNFSVITDAGDKRGRQAALHFEQMRMAFGALMNKAKVSTPVPLQIVAFRNNKEMRQFAPLWKGKPVEAAGLFQWADDRCFILLDMSVEDPWRVVFHEYGHQLLNGNVSFHAQPWFDEGFAEFFSTIRSAGNKINVGMPSDDNARILLQNNLMKVADLFQVQQQSSTYNETGDRRTIFYAESWLVVHYLYDTHAVPKLGVYFDMVLGQKKPVDQAIQAAFGMSAQDLDKAVGQYLRAGQYVYYPLPIPQGFDGSTYSVKPLDPMDVRADLADVHLHSVDYAESAVQEFQEILKTQPENPVALRGLGYAYLRKRDFHHAGEYFGKAAQLNSSDPRVLYYSAVLAQEEGTLGDDPDRLDIVRKQLEKSISLDPGFADAYGVLSFVLMMADEPEEAAKALQKAISLNPRNEDYSLNMSQILLMQKKYDEAIALLQKLSESTNPRIASSATLSLQSARRMREVAASGGEVRLRVGDQALHEKENTEPSPGAPPSSPPVPSAPIKFLKGKLLSVDCSSPPAALLILVSGPRTWRLHVKDYVHAVVIGADSFSCTWANQKAAVNYRATGTDSGDVVSVEIQ